MKATNGYKHKDYAEIEKRFNEICDWRFDADNDELVKLAAYIFSIETYSMPPPNTIEEKARYVLATRILSNYVIKNKQAFVEFPSPFFEKEDFPNKAMERNTRIAVECNQLIDDGAGAVESFKEISEKYNVSPETCAKAYYDFKKLDDEEKISRIYF